MANAMTLVFSFIDNSHFLLSYQFCIVPIQSKMSRNIVWVEMWEF